MALQVLSCGRAGRYVSGDFRFKSYCKSNPRKMVKVWAEKEFRNLSRMRSAGIRCPRPIHLRMHVLVMEFVGANGVAAPRLKVLPSCPNPTCLFWADVQLSCFLTLPHKLFQFCEEVPLILSIPQPTGSDSGTCCHQGA